MKISVNAEPCDVRSSTLEEVLVELGYTSAALATAVNGAFVARANRAGLELQDGDRVEILAPMQGG